MNEKIKVFEDLDVLVKMCRSKSDGASLKIEEDEIKNKIRGPLLPTKMPADDDVRLYLNFLEFE